MHAGQVLYQSSFCFWFGTKSPKSQTATELTLKTKADTEVPDPPASASTKVGRGNQPHLLKSCLAADDFSQLRTPARAPRAAFMPTSDQVAVQPLKAVHFLY